MTIPNNHLPNGPFAILKARQAGLPRGVIGRAHGQVCSDCGLANPYAIRQSGRVLSACCGQALMDDNFLGGEDEMTVEYGR